MDYHDLEHYKIDVEPAMEGDRAGIGLLAGTALTLAALIGVAKYKSDRTARSLNDYRFRYDFKNFDGKNKLSKYLNTAKMSEYPENIGAALDSYYKLLESLLTNVNKIRSKFIELARSAAEKSVSYSDIDKLEAKWKQEAYKFNRSIREFMTNVDLGKIITAPNANYVKSLMPKINDIIKIEREIAGDNLEEDDEALDIMKDLEYLSPRLYKFGLQIGFFDENNGRYSRGDSDLPSLNLDSSDELVSKIKLRLK